MAIVDLAAAGEAGEEHGETLLAAGRVAAAEFLHDVGIREPGRDLGAEREPIAELGARDVERLLVLRHFVDRVVLVFVRHEDHLLEVDHLHAELFLVLLHQLLGIVRTVERLAGRVLAGAGVVAADDEVRAAVVAADDRVPDRLARPAHPHRQRQQREVRRVLRVVVHDRLVAADAGVMIDVARLGHADDRVDQQVGFLFLRRRGA